MDISELSILKDTNYYSFVAEVLGAFKKMDRFTIEPLHDQKNDIKIVSESESQLEFQFKHDSINYCNGSFDFDDEGKVINFRALILPVGFFNRRRAKNNMQPVLHLFTTIAKHAGGDLQAKVRKTHYELRYDGLILTVVLAKNMQGKHYVSTWCEYEPR